MANYITYKRDPDRVWFYKNGLTNYDSMIATVVGNDRGKLHIVAKHPYEPGTSLYGFAHGNASIGSELVVSIQYQCKNQEMFLFQVESYGEEAPRNESRYGTGDLIGA